MVSSLVITSPASSLLLLTTAEMREAAGVADSSEDAALTLLEARGAARIMAECQIAIGSGGEPTLLRETLTETFYAVEVQSLVLARRHRVTVTSITADDEVIDAADYLVDPESGIVRRLYCGRFIHWCAEKIVVVYAAGFTTPPPELKYAAMQLLGTAYAEASGDAYIKSEETEVVGVDRVRRDYWTGVSTDTTATGLPSLVSAQLTRFKNMRLS